MHPEPATASARPGAPSSAAVPARSTPVWTLVLTAAGIFMVILDALVVVTALPVIHTDVGGDVAALQWILSAYLLAFGAGIITASSLGDRFGRRRVFVVGLLLFTVASAACALAPSISWLIAARAAQGIGAAIVTPLSLSLLVAAFPPERRGSVLGIWAGIGGVAVAAGPLVGGGVTQALTWHWIFWINVPIGLVAAALVTRKVAESRGPDTRLDLPGAGFVTAGSIGLLWGLTRGNAVGWTSAEILGSLGAGVALLIAFLLWERRALAPMVPLRLLRVPTFAAANVVAFLSLGALLSAAFFLAQFVQTVQGFSPFQSGLRFLPWTATPLVVAPIAGRLADRIGPRPLIVVGLLLQAVGLGAVAALATPTVSFETLVLPLIVGGSGISMVLPAAPVAAFGAVDRSDLGRASGLYNSAQRFGGAFVLAIASSAFTAYGQLGPRTAFMAGFRPAIEVSVVLSLIGAAVALVIRRPSPAPHAAPAGAAASAPPV
jgi:EmrB/QacA subfamily drug resistance transporter